mmetsp:Transcript_14145/g.29324  ORF Transcript_14145/g.29324 Transcript_14145/m.29324 type:complete len:150 (-) Transcript_14145:140-589(-)
MLSFSFLKKRKIHKDNSYAFFFYISIKKKKELNTVPPPFDLGKSKKAGRCFLTSITHFPCKTSKSSLRIPIDTPGIQENGKIPNHFLTNQHSLLCPCNSYRTKSIQRNLKVSSFSNSPRLKIFEKKKKKKKKTREPEKTSLLTPKSAMK